VPLPGFVVDGATAPLKEMVSSAVAWLLGAMGYAVERAGVVLAVNGREMLVADACSGLNSIVSLLAMGLLYAHLTRATVARAALLALAVIPIAVAANIGRVLALVLITVHAGPDAAQGWVHDALGLSVFVVALLSLIAIDRFAHRITPPDSPDSFHCRVGGAIQTGRASRGSRGTRSRPGVNRHGRGGRGGAGVEASS
jgi:exosortase